MPRPMLIDGLHGLGDNIHQRAIVRYFLSQGWDIWLKTPWPCLYHDLVGQRLRLVDPQSRLRTQAKNASRESERFTRMKPPSGTRIVRVMYSPEGVRQSGSVLAAMALHCGIIGAPLDFRMPVPAAWREKAQRLVGTPGDRPLLIVRPLLNRTEWGGCAARNPEHSAYVELLKAICGQFRVVSIADLAPGREWIVGLPYPADVTLHNGELDTESLIGLVASATLVFCSPGFAVPLAQAVGTPVICVFGGYENSRSFSAAKLTPYLGIDPVKPCECFRHNHGCDKHIDLAYALHRVKDFADAAIARVATATT